LLVVVLIARPLSVCCCGVGRSLTKQYKWF
jgi:hypothetical protein